MMLVQTKEKQYVIMIQRIDPREGDWPGPMWGKKKYIKYTNLESTIEYAKNLNKVHEGFVHYVLEYDNWWEEQYGNI